MRRIYTEVFWDKEKELKTYINSSSCSQRGRELELELELLEDERVCGGKQRMRELGQEGAVGESGKVEENGEGLGDQEVREEEAQKECRDWFSGF